MQDSKNASLNLKDFRSFVSDLARPNRFEVEISPPEAYDGYKKEDLFLLSWIAETAQIPAKTQSEVKMRFYGMDYVLPGDYTKENLTIGFLNSYGWEGKNFFDTWFQYMQFSSSSNIRTPAYSMLNDSRITIRQLGRTEKDIISRTVFYDVFPTNISAIDLSMAENDSVEKFTVSFAYSYFDTYTS